MTLSGLHRRSLVVVVLGLCPPLWIGWLLWFAPVDGLTADRTALAARDFTALWGAGRAAAEQSLAVLSDPTAFTAYLRMTFGPGIPSQIWPYPPPMLLLARPLAECSLSVALAVYSCIGLIVLWLATSLGGLAPTMRAAILLSPAVAANALAGQNGTIIAALLGGGLLAVDRTPRLSGILLGAVAVKPQFAMLLPLCLVASFRWRTALWGCMSFATLALTAAWAFGYTPWIDFFSANQNTVATYIGAPWQSDPAQLIFSSVFMASRSVGATLDFAYLMQIVVGCGCACRACIIWRDPTLDTRARTAATLPLVLLAAPWVHTYDMPMLAVSIALLVPGAGTVRRALLGVAWLWPGLPPLIPFPPLLAVLSIGSVAWIAGASARRGCYALRPA